MILYAYSYAYTVELYPNANANRRENMPARSGRAIITTDCLQPVAACPVTTACKTIIKIHFRAFLRLCTHIDALCSRHGFPIILQLYYITLQLGNESLFKAIFSKHCMCVISTLFAYIICWPNLLFDVFLLGVICWSCVHFKIVRRLVAAPTYVMWYRVQTLQTLI